MARATKTNTTRRRPQRSDIALPGEKVVRETSRAVKVKPVKEGRDAKRPTPDAALDRRREVAASGPAGIERSETAPKRGGTRRRAR